MMASKCLVLRPTSDVPDLDVPDLDVPDLDVPDLDVPGLDVKVLPCIGSQTHTTGCPDRSTAFSSGGSAVATLPAPRRVISVSRPGTLAGFNLSHRATT